MMLFVEMLLQMLFSLLAIFGFYCAVRSLLEYFFTPHNLTVAVEVKCEEDARSLDLLLHEASFSMHRPARRRIALLISSDLMQGFMGEGEMLFSEYERLVERYGAECFVIDMD